MKIVVVSDTHCRHKSVKLPPGDLLIHCGDVTNKGTLTEVTDFLHWFASQPFNHKIFIAGNHDFYFERVSDAALKTVLPAGIIYLNDSGVVVNGINIWGSPVTPWFYDWAFNRRRGNAINKHWELIPPQTNLLITHGPPFGILDAVVNETHSGDVDLLKRIEKVKPSVHLFGHIHESYGRVKRNGTTFINASVLNERYELVHPPVAFQL